MLRDEIHVCCLGKQLIGFGLVVACLIELHRLVIQTLVGFLFRFVSGKHGGILPSDWHSSKA